MHPSSTGPRVERRMRRRRQRRLLAGLAALPVTVLVVVVGVALAAGGPAQPVGADGTAVGAATPRDDATAPAAVTTASATTAPLVTSSPTIVPTTIVAPPLPATAAVPPVPDTTVVPVPPAPVTRPVLEKGAEGPEVAALQTRLALLRYVPGEVDGVFGSGLLYAVWAFQKSQGLEPTGVVDEATWQALDRPHAVMPRGPLDVANRLEVDLTRQLAVVYHDSRQVLITHISSGELGVSETNVGTFDIDERVNGWQDVEHGRVYRPLWFDGNIGIHGFSSVPTHPASHGCVRIPNAVADLIFPLFAIGDTVVVF